MTNTQDRYHVGKSDNLRKEVLKDSEVIYELKAPHMVQVILSTQYKRLKNKSRISTYFNSL